uniref:Galectin n=2 Tax=Paramormyrops kingsleyae TaxID=1676925 RepID=A0A3B3QPV9_9TELE|nr:beta-galactoside-binding lectin-like [Paramormyrops kingsleyae]
MNIGSWALLLLCVLHLHFGHTKQEPELTLKDMAMKTTNHLKITGIPLLNGSRFYIEIGYNVANIGIHFDVRFDHEKDHHVIVINSRKEGIWSAEQRDKRFPFKQGEKFKVIINFSKNKFLVSMPGNIILSFPNRFAADKFMFIRVRGDLRIKGFDIM